MPKKTKKEKILAEYRKKIKQLNQSLVVPAPQIKIPTIIKSRLNDQSTNDNKLLTYFFQDFKKSLFIIGFIIALEIGLYFAKLIQ
ncbi:hypothetical protein COW98_05225 [Candidatus Roizmanbacteria bacterium CG22_combo_CG10-13_8_21_14_all_35_9]|uniref:Uncharacterized protein n=4 Tax=Candidatus Roizmaniibacteriota TaxID=1752723 RepID=A0A2M8F1I8_9BACT|nr:MAG: hypothetical protein COX47_03315 [Candidatus Roizmanbacteria bacterium CG23_combo_of_CG06-09_8_20_14_all_35_49]PIP62225.1 MAG: hypothetical protein COW98_05225 [Candidatus Roizmanbacteria bacterium CG22_combo_CG10-13_8_21_14_all_35_9]PIY71295.1 MAG: hypothetical protein COY88_01130 [Candidatus Roizmanbacteria bacterium CG_4_10_14_0_8_um_filter_35_28]PJC33161.1 MAG: hypothetical protein CO048_03695 [Candidatus Roizmanbacteria bacterium CG_4_9_14_0_2_um_filter_35_15]PJC82734.1 MAG: hypoth